ncbi:MAG: formylglycine-generating enzyme family protein [Planctomycetaceae bacterium]
MADQPRQTLCDLIQRFGPEVASDPKRCEALLKDLLSNGFRREVNVLVSAVREGVPSELRQPSGGAPLAAVVVQQARKLHEELGFDQSLAEWAVQSWAAALGTYVAPALPKTVEDWTNAVGIYFRLIPPGSFLMGDNASGQSDEKPAHQVTITRPFYCGAFPVTQVEYQAVTGQTPSHFKGDRRPVEQVSWDDAMAFCAKLNQRNESRPSGMIYRLLSEAEWEYCCRAGTTTSWCCQNEEQLGEYAWFSANAGGETHDVGTKKANAWGLHDFHGNVWEWCLDWKGSYGGQAVNDPVNLIEASSRVYRGGSWCFGASDCRSAFRLGYTPGPRSSLLGFRLALGPELK